MRPGVKTSEFWVALGGGLLALLNNSLGLGIPVEAFITLASYVISRGWAKSRGGS